MVFGSCSSPSKYSLKDYLTISMVVFSLAKYVFFTCEDIMFPREGSPGILPELGNPLYGQYRYMRPQSAWFFVRFRHIWGINFDHFG